MEYPESLSLTLSYEIERVMYGIAIVLGFIASVYTIRKFRRCCKKNLDVAARLLSYKISLSVADALILFVYAPTQLVWISTFWWYGGEILCRVYKFTVTFAFHLTGNMQVLIAFDRLISMTRINKLHVKGTTDYNTRLFLSLSWILAIIFSLPQLVIFKIVYHNNGSPQCSSIWQVLSSLLFSSIFSWANEYTQLYLKEQERREIMEYYSEDNEMVNNSLYNSSIEEEWIRMQEWEKMYNIVHVSMMCVIPYLLELIFYALILSLLSDAEKGEFSGFRRFIHKKIVRLCHMKRREERKERFNSLPTIFEDPQSDSPIQSPLKIKLTRRPSRSVVVNMIEIHNSSPTNGRRVNLRVSYRNRFQSVDVGMRRMTMSGGTQDISSLHTNENESGERSHLLGIRHQSRRASAPCGDNKVNQPRVSVPWMQTVIVARRNARKKAFLMLSFNLLLWLPYCAHAIISSFVELNYLNFQFACALVVFNAITNILL
uniref:Gnrr-4 n=1 Tax=Pristionchus pacificus TaxID=54126 RepID=A0A2A6BEB9_PRIPA|eukprot:PDM64229.1 gnrr-4 [Pristionchus pacificus]